MSGAPLNRHHIHDLRGIGNPRFARDPGALVEHVEASAAILGNLSEGIEKPSSRRSDSARLGGGIGERVPGAEGGQCADVVLDAVGRDALDDVLDARVKRRGQRLRSRGGHPTESGRKKTEKKGWNEGAGAHWE